MGYALWSITTRKLFPFKLFSRKRVWGLFLNWKINIHFNKSSITQLVTIRNATGFGLSTISHHQAKGSPEDGLLLKSRNRCTCDLKHNTHKLLKDTNKSSSSSSSSSSSCTRRFKCVFYSLILKMKLVLPSLPRSSYVPSSMSSIL